MSAGRQRACAPTDISTLRVASQAGTDKFWSSGFTDGVGRAVTASVTKQKHPAREGWCEDASQKAERTPSNIILGN